MAHPAPPSSLRRACLRPTRPALGALAAIALATLSGPLARARPVAVRARTAVSLELDRAPDGLRVRGRLVDDTGRPVPFEKVHLDLPDQPTTARTTDGEGGFEVPLEPADVERLLATHGQRIAWTLRYDGDRDHGEASASGVLDLRRTSVELAVSVDPTVVALDETEVRVHLDLAAHAMPVSDAEVRVRVGDGTELVGRTGDSGRATFLIRAGLLGAAGAYAVQARFLGDPLHAPADAEATLQVLLPSRVTLRVAREGDVQTGRYRFSGRLADADGPIAGATVTLLLARPAAAAPTTVQAVATTHADGIFLVAVPAADLAPEPAREGAVPTESFEFDVSAVYRPTDGRHQGALSRPVRVRVPPPGGVPTRWYLVGAGLVALTLLFAQALRQRLFARTFARLRRRRRPPQAHPALPPRDLTTAEPALELASPARRGARHDFVAGLAVDAHTQAPLGGVTLALSGPAGVRSAVTHEDGSFAFGPLPPGPHQLLVTLRDYLPRTLDWVSPHAGELDGARLPLVAARRRLRETYARAIRRFGAELRWGTDTPRDAWSRARRAEDGDEEALLELRRLVEQSWFADRASTARDVARAHELLVRIEGRR